MLKLTSGIFIIIVKHQPVLDCLAMYRYSYVKAIVLK